MIAPVHRVDGQASTHTVCAPPALLRVDPNVVEPHKRLMAAVLETVLDDYRGSPYRRKAGLGPGPDIWETRRAIAYVASTDREWPFSFENICEALGLDAGCLRRELDQQTKK